MTAKAMICCTCQKSTNQSCSGMIRTVQKQWRQANDYQCPTITILHYDNNCRTVHNSQILCCKSIRASDSITTGQPAVYNAKVHLKCTAVCRIERISEMRSTIVELLQQAGNDDHAEFRPTTSTQPASYEEHGNSHHHPKPTNLRLI